MTRSTSAAFTCPMWAIRMILPFNRPCPPATTTPCSSRNRLINPSALLPGGTRTAVTVLEAWDSSAKISSPNSASNQETLQISERVMDTFNNATRAYDVDGDGKLDADNDNDSVINEDTTTPDPPDFVIFDLDKTDAANWKLQEKMPDYSTASLVDYRTTRVLCENVTAFSNNLVRKNDLEFFSDLVEILLTLNDGINEVSFKTRAKARMID